MSAASMRSNMPATTAAVKPQLPALGPAGGLIPAARSMQQHLQAMRSGGASGAAYYPTPAFQHHMQQLGKLTRFLLPLFSFVVL